MEIQQEQWRFSASNGEGDIFARLWLPENPVAIVQIAHGMSEYSARYDEFARFLAHRGFAVVANDHAGHGQSMQGHLGAFAATAGGFDHSVQDLHCLFLIAEEKINGLNTRGTPGASDALPRFLFGHSMGSIMVALYATRWEGLSGLVMCATPAAMKFSHLFRFMAGFVAKTRGYLARSPVLERLTGSLANLPLEEAVRRRAWLTRDVEKIREFSINPLCGFDYTAGGYAAILRGYHRINSKNWSRSVPDIPILITAGADDSSSGSGKEPAKYATRLATTGHNHIDIKLFPECRHEIINELNRQEIFAFLCDWFTDKLPR